MDTMPKLERYRSVVVLTGAGISVASGLSPYRGPGGLWETNEGLQDLATATSLGENPDGVWSLFGPLRESASAATPNDGHRALASWEEYVVEEGGSFTLVTQNVDGLHQRAGSANVIELHGSAFVTSCTNENCDLEPFHDTRTLDKTPACPRCGSNLRPGVVLFDEPIPGGAEWKSKRALRDCDLFVAIGTSGTVSPASNFVRAAEYNRARTVLMNLEPMKPRHPAFDEEYLGRSEVLLPDVLGFAGATRSA